MKRKMMITVLACLLTLTGCSGADATAEILADGIGEQIEMLYGTEEKPAAQEWQPEPKTEPTPTQVKEPIVTEAPTFAETVPTEWVVPEPHLLETTVPDGYISVVDGDWQQVTIYDGYSTLRTHAYVFSETLVLCREMTIAMNVSMKANTKCRDWQLWGRVGGEFKKLALIDLPNGDGYASQTVFFDNPVTLDAVVVTPTIPGGYSWSMGLAVIDAWTAG